MTLQDKGHRLQLHRNLRYSNGIDWITEDLLFDTEVVAGPDICSNFGHAPDMLCASYRCT